MAREAERNELAVQEKQTIWILSDDSVGRLQSAAGETKEEGPEIDLSGRLRISNCLRVTRLTLCGFDDEK
jgi:hypothetical protein